jgi:hypothetical protein
LKSPNLSRTITHRNVVFAGGCNVVLGLEKGYRRREIKRLAVLKKEKIQDAEGEMRQRKLADNTTSVQFCCIKIEQAS